jgi:hypothetical protein
MAGSLSRYMVNQISEQELEKCLVLPNSSLDDGFKKLCVCVKMKAKRRVGDVVEQ